MVLMHIKVFVSESLFLYLAAKGGYNSNPNEKY